MCIADSAMRIHHAYQGHPSHFEEIHFLAIKKRDPVSRVRQPDKRDILIGPVTGKLFLLVRTDRQYLGSPLCE